MTRTVETTVKLPTSVRSFKRNILKCLEKGTNEQMANSIGWYSDAHEIAKDLFGNPELGAAIIAALSPLTNWNRNIKLAEMVANGIDPMELPCLPNSRKAVARILNGERWQDVLKGEKVNTFAHTIWLRGNYNKVTVDVHAADIAYGLPLTPKGSARVRKAGVSSAEYKAIEKAYKLVAAQLGISCTELQAIVWSIHRGTHE